MDLGGPGAQRPDADGPRTPEGPPQGRIQDLVRTYIFLNDPRSRQLTMKFSALLVALGAIAAVAYVSMSDAGDGVVPGDDARDVAASASAMDEACMPATEYDAWLAEHQQARVTHVETEGTDVCVTYAS